MNTDHQSDCECPTCNVAFSLAKSQFALKRMAVIGDDCPQCHKSKLRYYDGCLGYEAARCYGCGFEIDLNAEANARGIGGAQ